MFASVLDKRYSVIFHALLSISSLSLVVKPTYVLRTLPGITHNLLPQSLSEATTL